MVPYHSVLLNQWQAPSGLLQVMTTLVSKLALQADDWLHWSTIFSLQFTLLLCIGCIALWRTIPTVPKVTCIHHRAERIGRGSRGRPFEHSRRFKTFLTLCGEGYVVRMRATQELASSSSLVDGRRSTELSHTATYCNGFWLRKQKVRQFPIPISLDFPLLEKRDLTTTTTTCNLQ